VDDSNGVGLEGEQYRFSAVVIGPDDRDWTKKVLAAVAAIKR